ncbi:MAG: PP2C family protein-serine/threonine phosphatase [Planctomycetota bacterium]|jgi:serine phosphatase RsbU (regulator of sigma subunit)
MNVAARANPRCDGARAAAAQVQVVRSMRVLLVDPSSPGFPTGAEELLSDSGWSVKTAVDYGKAASLTRSDEFDAIVIPLSANVPATAPDDDLTPLMREVDSRRMATVVLAGDRLDLSLQAASLVDVVPGSVSKQQLHSRLTTLSRYQALIKRMDQELANMARLGKQLNQHFTEVDQEMRLAGRLQRDFLPQVRESIGPLRFSTIFRPASWVSGDIYDIVRVDERHVAFYVADAVGHGMAASLLTMFIKKAVVTKRVHDNGYELLSPSETMRGLNEALEAQSLPNCQFVTACYCLVDLETLELQFARGGHPLPLLVSADGVVTELPSSGSLLGLFAAEEFPTSTVQLKPGEKLILYSDGLEVAYHQEKDKSNKCNYYRQVFDELAPLPADEMVARISGRLDNESGSLNPRDDVTVVAVEVASPNDGERAVS